MKSKLMCLLLCMGLLLTGFTGCAHRNEEEEDDSVDRSAKTITMWVMTGNETTPKAEELVAKEFSKITKAKFKTNVVIKFCTEDEYYTKLESTISANQADIQLKEQCEKDLRVYLRLHKGEKTVSELTADFYAEHPEYEKFARMAQEEDDEDEEETKVEEETLINEYGITELKYPEEKENQVDIFYLSGYQKYMKYYEDEWLSSLSEELTTSSRKLNSYISSSLLNGVQIDGSVYAIPNNVPIGQYTYMMIDKELFDRYYCKIESVRSVLDISTFLNDMKNMNGDLDPDDPNYVIPLASTYEDCMKMLCWYWELAYTDQSVYRTHYDEKTGRNCVLKKRYTVQMETTNEKGETETKKVTITAPDILPDTVYRIDGQGRYLDANGNPLDYRYEADPEGAWIFNQDEKNEKKQLVYSKSGKDAGGLYLVDGEGNTVTPENDRRAREDAATKMDANGNVRPTYHYSYSRDSQFSILGAMMKDADRRSRGKINLGFNSLFTNSEYRDMFATLKDYDYREFYGEAKDGQRAAVFFEKGDSRIKESYEKDGVYRENGRDYYVVVAQYPEATEEELYGNMFAVYGNSTNLSRSMKVITYLNTNKDMRDLLQYGIEGKHYSRNEDGTIHLLTSPDDRYGTYRMDIRKTGNCFIATPSEEMGADAWTYAKIQNNDSLINPLLGFDFNLATADSDYGLDVALIDHINELSREALDEIDECAGLDDLLDLIGNKEDGYVRKFAASAGDVKLSKATNASYDPEMPMGPDAGGEQTPDPSGSSPYAVYQTWLNNYGYAYVPSAAD